MVQSQPAALVPISTKPCPKCGGKRINNTDDKERFGHCEQCHTRWFVVKGGLVS